MTHKELTKHTLNSIEDMLTSQYIVITPQDTHRLKEILHDHNTAYKEAITTIIDDAILVLKHSTHTNCTLSILSTLTGILNKMQYLA